MTTSAAESAWLASMCTDAAISVLDDVLAATDGLDAGVAARLREAIGSSLQPALENVVERMSDPTIALQPILHVEGRTIIGFEALARFGGHSETGEAFRRAAQRGFGVDVERLALRAALPRIADLPDGVYLGVNLSSEALTDPLVLSMLDEVDTNRLVIELTQQSEISNVPQLLQTFKTLQANGGVFCTDGAGVGFFLEDRLLELEPEMIKIARSLVSHCDEHPEQRQRMMSLVRLARRIGALVVAIGVERAEELEVLASIGVDAAQGHLLGEPSADISSFDVHGGFLATVG